MRTSLAGVAIAALGLWQDSQPSIHRDTWPGPRGGGHALAYDSRHRMTMLYGDRGGDATVLWGWNGEGWQAFHQPGPGLRRHIKMAYDPGRGRLVLFGGLDDSGRNFMGDTWEWDGGRWRQVATDGPWPRASYSLLYDPMRRRVMLFGGLTPDGPRTDLWEWDGARWTSVADGGPSPRGEAGMAYDPRSKTILVSGGTAYERTASSGGRSGWSVQRTAPPRDTWAWDGRSWRMVDDGGVARSFTNLVGDPVTGSPLRIGGESDTGYHGDLWQWLGAQWRLIPGAMIPPRHGVVAALDTRRKRVVVFGGSAGSSQHSTALSDLWEWDGQRWHERDRRSTK